MVHNQIAHLGIPALLFLVGHLKRTAEGLSDVAVVPWVDTKLGAVEHGSTSSELAEDDGTMLLWAGLAILTDNELVASQVHTLAQASNGECIRDRKQGHVL
jgi:hypothetical protein